MNYTDEQRAIIRRMGDVSARIRSELLDTLQPKDAIR